MKKKIGLYEITWQDAIGDSAPAWRGYCDSRKWGKESSEVVTEAGFLLEETDAYILLAARINEGDRYAYSLFGGLMKIPKAWILKKKKLDTIEVEIPDS